MSFTRFQDLKNKVVMITGAGGGFGSALSHGFAEMGARLSLTDIDAAGVRKVRRGLDRNSRRHFAMACDLRKQRQFENFVRKTVAALGRIDVLVNIVGHTRYKPIVQMSLKEFDYTVEMCLRTAFIASHTVGAQMIKQGTGGSVIHMSSIAGARALGRGTGIYAAGKAGVNALVRELAVEWAPHNIRVNAIAPCQFLTTPLVKLLNDPKFEGREALKAKMLSRIPLGRFGEPDDVVGPCVFLASGSAAMVTGHVLYVDGGYTAQ